MSSVELPVLRELLPNLNLPHCPQQLLHVRSLVQRIYFRPGQHSVFVEYENGSLANARNRRAVAQNAVFLRYFSMRIKISAQWEVHGADIFLLPCDVAESRIYAYVQDLGIECGERLPGGVERRYL
jgi:hypothetical protein